MRCVMVIDSYQASLALILGLFVGGVAGYLGSLMISKRMALVGGAFGHLALPGISLALVYNFDVGLGALMFLLVGTGIIWFLHYRTQLPFEALTGVVFSLSLAISFLILPKKELDIALLGDISQLTVLSVALASFFACVIFLLAKKLYNHMILASISTDIAVTEKINLRRENFLYLLCIALVVALGVRIVGGLMTAALVTIPAATSSNISSTLSEYAYRSLLLGSLSCCMGILLHIGTGNPVGPLVIISSGLFFLISLIIRVPR